MARKSNTKRGYSSAYASTRLLTCEVCKQPQRRLKTVGNKLVCSDCEKKLTHAG